MSQTGSINKKINNARLSHAYITEGGSVNILAGLSVCSATDGNEPCLNCEHCRKFLRGIHPDIMYISRLPKKREILVDQIRELKKDIVLLPNESERKVYIINDADTMNISAQNAFLQMLEEPPSYAVFILETSNPTALLPTVRSRCVRLGTILDGNNGDKIDTDIEMSEIAGEFMTAISRGNVELVRMMFRIEKLNGREFSSFIAAVRHLEVDMFKTPDREKAGTLDMRQFETIEQTLRKCEEMLSLNVNAGYISGFIFSTLIK